MSNLSKSDLDGLLSRSLISREQYAALLPQVIPGFNPSRWLFNAAGALGAALLLCALVCFFAYNWSSMGLLLKMGTPLLLLAACGWGAYYKGVQSGAGSACAVGAGVCVGLFLAVYGQTFQTGSFVYELFFTWSACLFGLAFVAGNRWLALMGVYVLALALGGYNEYVSGRIYPMMTALFALAAAGAEWAYLKTKKYPAYTLFFWAPLLAWLWGWSVFYGGGWVVALPAYLVLGAYSFFVRKNLLMLGFCVFMLDGYIAYHWIRVSSFEYVFRSAVGVLALYSASAFGLYTAHVYWKGDYYAR